MRTTLTALLLCTATWAAAQQSFTQRVTARQAGDGMVVLHQDAALDALVNGTALPKNKTAATTAPATTTPATTTSRQDVSRPVDDPAAEEAVVETSEIDLGDGRKVYRNSIKMQGFRVQVYSGGNSRKAKQAAESTARQVKGYFPDQPVYTHFYSPRWICRVGDFRTMEEANEMLRQMKETGAFGQAVIVKSVVQIAL